MTNKVFSVAGVTYENDNGKDRQGLIKRIAAGYKKNDYIESWDGYSKKEALEDGIEGSEFEGQTINNIVRLEKEPTNPYDPNAIKVYIKDVNDGEHHVGYIKKNETSAVSQLLNEPGEYKIDLEFTGGRVRSIEYDTVSDVDYYEDSELTRGLSIHFKSNVKLNPTEPKVVLTPEETAKEEKKQKAIEAGAKMEAAGKKMQKAGGAMMGCGCLLSIVVTIPIIIIVLFFL